MNKRLESEYREFIYKGEQTPFSLGTLAVVIFCTTLLIVATFTKIDLSHWWFLSGDNGLFWGIKKHNLVPQIPVVMLTSALLGVRFGSLVVLLYLLIGFFLYPVFGFGGGLEYIKSYFFGYILGFFAAVLFGGRILSSKFNTKNMILASIIGVLAIHSCGIFYSFILGIFKTFPYHPNFGVIFAQIIYDILFSMFAIIIAKPLKYVFWIAMKNEPKKSKNNNQPKRKKAKKDKN